MPRARVTKAEAEWLIDALDVGDTPGFVELLANLLARLTGVPSSDWHLLVVEAASIGGWTTERASAVDQGDLDALERLAIDLSELRSLRVDD